MDNYILLNFILIIFNAFKTSIGHFMKGIILKSYLQHVENSYGIEVLNLAIDRCKLESGGLYINMLTYNDEEINSLITETSSIVNKSANQVEQEFGNHFFNDLLNEYGSYFEKSNMKDFIHYLNNYIHPEIDSSIDGAITPKFKLDERNDYFILTYTSERKMSYFALGLLLACNNYFDNEYEIKLSEISGKNTYFEFHVCHQ